MDEDIKKMLEKNQEMITEILRNSKKTKRYIVSLQVFGILKILIIVIPIVLGIIYLPPLLKDALNSYQELLGIGEGVKQIDPTSIDLDNLPPEVLKYLK